MLYILLSVSFLPLGANRNGAQGIRFLQRCNIAPADFDGNAPDYLSLSRESRKRPGLLTCSYA